MTTDTVKEDDLTRDLAARLASPTGLGGATVTRPPAFKVQEKVSTLDHLSMALLKLQAAHADVRALADELVGRKPEQKSPSLTFSKDDKALIGQVHSAAQDVENLGLAISQEVARIRAGI